jgi:hypothetical protein
MSRDIDRMFGIDDDKTIIEISHGDTYIKKTLDEQEIWPDVVKAFFDMLCGCGYVIDQVKAHDIIQEIETKNLEGLRK